MLGFVSLDEMDEPTISGHAVQYMLEHEESQILELLDRHHRYQMSEKESIELEVGECAVVVRKDGDLELVLTGNPEDEEKLSPLVIMAVIMYRSLQDEELVKRTTEQLVKEFKETGRLSLGDKIR